MIYYTLTCHDIMYITAPGQPLARLVEGQLEEVGGVLVLVTMTGISVVVTGTCGIIITARSIIITITIAIL